MHPRALATAAALAAMAAGACGRTDNGDIVVKRPTQVDVKTTTDTLHVTTKTETVNAPVVGTKQETVIVKKPVVGTQKKVIKVPQIQRP